MKNNSPPIAARRAMWLLFTDANSRFNLLIDECNHIQETIISALSRTGREVFGIPESEPSLDARLRPKSPNKDRPTVNVAGEVQSEASSRQSRYRWHRARSSERNIRDSRYYMAKPQERGLRNLWGATSTLAAGIAANQEELRTSYLTANHLVGERSDSQYWFFSLRAHYLTVVMPEYLHHIQHAHLKLIQLLENMPGALPGPTLLRRWSSGGYGEVLSAYSRHVNWQVQDLFWDCCKVPGVSKRGDDDDAFCEWRDGKYLVHAWVHEPTSEMTIRRVENISSSKHPGNGFTREVTTIRSSYFYLEQVVLFPLLYHETTHAYTESIRHGTTARGIADGHASGAKLWFDRAEETISLLNSAASFKPLDELMWRRLVTDIWIDTISLTLCGPSYVFALALQLFAITGPLDEKTYADHFVAQNSRIPWNKSGTADRRVANIQYAMDCTENYFWAARLRLAIRLVEHVRPDFFKEQDGPFKGLMGDLVAAVSAWESSGSQAMHPEHVSQEHGDWWQYRLSINEWVENVVWSQIREFADRLRDLYPSRRDKNEYHLDDNCRSTLERFLRIYRKRLFGDEKDVPGTLTGKHVLGVDDLCAAIRWRLADKIISETDLSLPRPGRPSHDDWADRWVSRYANYMRNDGSATFRIAVEYSSAVRDVIRAAAYLVELYGRDKSSRITGLLERLPDRESQFLREIEACVLKDTNWHTTMEDFARRKSKIECEAVELPDTARAAGEALSKEREDWQEAVQRKAKFLAMLPHLRSEERRLAWKSLAALTDRTSERLRELFSLFLDRGQSEVGTFILGVLKTGYIGREKHPTDSGAYSRALAELNFNYARMRLARRDTLGDLHGDDESDFQFFCLFGEYNFAVFSPDHTPVEKDIIIPTVLPTTIKARAVQRIVKAQLSKISYTFVRVSQVAYKYHWQWVILAEAASKLDNVDVYLSSAWEDVIVVMYVDSFDQVADISEKLGLNLRPWVDIHTNIGFSGNHLPHFDPLKSNDQLPPGNPELKGELERAKEAALDRIPHRFLDRVKYFIQAANPKLGLIREITGRQDVEVAWKCTHVRELIEVFDLLPSVFWYGISSITTTFSLPVPRIDSADTEVRIESRIMQRHHI